MSNGKVVDTIVLNYFKDKLNTKFSPIDHTHSWNDLENRPFGEEYTVLVEGEPTTPDYYDEYFRGWWEKFNGIIEVGKSYNVTFDGVLYENLVCYNNDMNSNATLGVVYQENGFTDYPFDIQFDTYYDVYLVHCEGINETHTLKIEESIPIVKTIDEKYIPDTIARVSDISTEQVQADWNQNNETAPDYVKNRTHWVGDLTEVAIIDNATVNSDNYLFDGCEIKPDTTYIVVWDGVRYERTSYAHSMLGEMLSCVGNESLFAGNDNGDPFLCMCQINTNQIGFYPNTDSHTVSLYEMRAEIHKLDKKFLPDSALIGAKGTGAYSEIFNSYSNNEASGHCSHAEGGSTTASGNNSHAEGKDTTASGDCSHAEGYWTTTSGINSHAEGCGTIATDFAQHVQGKYNIEDTDEKYAHIIGNGSYDGQNVSPSNAHTVDWNGNAWYAGDVYVGSYSGTNEDEGMRKLATEEYVDTSIANLVDSAPEDLNTLNELATAMKENSDVVDTLNNAIGNKADISYVDEKIANQTNSIDNIRQNITALQEDINNVDVSEDIAAHNSDAEAHADIRELIDANSGKVEQAPTSAEDEDYRVLLSGTADDETHTEATKKDSGLKYNPNTGVLKVNAIDMGIGVIKADSELSAFVLEFK